MQRIGKKRIPPKLSGQRLIHSRMWATSLVQSTYKSEIELKLRSRSLDPLASIQNNLFRYSSLLTVVGWVQGSHISEEAWLSWPLLQGFDLVTISVGYRLAPENLFPTFINDCRDVFEKVISRSSELGFDSSKVIFGGSSAGGCIATSLAQQAVKAKIPVLGVLSNVPITCDPRHFPKDKYEYTSYDQCKGTLLSSGEMWQLWEMVVPDKEAGKDYRVSAVVGGREGSCRRMSSLWQDRIRCEMRRSPTQTN